MVAFGIGCFHFGLRNAHEGQLKDSEYIKILQDSLGTIKSINAISVDYPLSKDGEVFEGGAGMPRLNDGNGFYPKLDFFELSFEIYIPFRVQSELLECPQDLLRTSVEKFRFKLINNYAMPIAFIESVGAKRESTPSDAVRLLREYLNKELKTTNLQLETLGPSPFHANLFLLPHRNDGPNRQGTAIFRCSQIKQEGYDEIEFHYDSNQFPDEKTAKDELYQDIDSELDLFYEIRSAENLNLFAWQKIDERLQILLNLQSDRSFLGRLKKFFKRGDLVDELVSSLCDFKRQSLFSDASLEKSYGDRYWAKQNFLKTYIDEELKDKQKYPISDVADLVKFIDGRHGKALENTFVVVASILGGVVGSLLTIYAQSSPVSQLPGNSKASISQSTINSSIVTNGKSTDLTIP